MIMIKFIDLSNHDDDHEKHNDNENYSDHDDQDDFQASSSAAADVPAGVELILILTMIR